MRCRVHLPPAEEESVGQAACACSPPHVTDVVVCKAPPLAFSVLKRNECTDAQVFDLLRERDVGGQLVLHGVHVLLQLLHAALHAAALLRVLNGPTAAVLHWRREMEALVSGSSSPQRADSINKIQIHAEGSCVWSHKLHLSHPLVLVHRVASVGHILHAARGMGEWRLTTQPREQ